MRVREQNTEEPSPCVSLLMQWVRNEIKRFGHSCRNELIGIRYFSCVSEKASEMGFNYVFPTSGRQKSVDLPFCEVLAKSFQLTTPVYLHEYESVSKCERELKKSLDYSFIDK